MSDYPLQPGQYTIENTHHVMQLVTAGDIIHGDRRSSSATQTWKLTYDHDGFAMFQGIPPNAADGDFIGIDTQAS
ncbi:uncharacterized protein EDB91DRAFT_1249123 [Suillus paluster]|uniref:uncharacterized protein n=1 Tax=Suillus paluster TaxID=48578 RepID=UPI001B876806|nr:uncharacterized protein EDB91DRAFT_1249123 [Suillus paluster]KAG1738599.1 hypothetical protein EDB91DRAFT_1249123 [Suillus paluster]